MSEVIINDADSARVRNSDPDTNFYAPTLLPLKAEADYTHMWFIKFDLSGISTSGLTGVTINVYVPEEGFVGVAAAYQRVTEDWDKETITWNNKPDVSATYANSTSLFLWREEWYRAHISLSEFELMVATNYGLRARPTQYYGAISSVCSSYYYDTTKRPYLKLTYAAAGSGQVIIFSE